MRMLEQANRTERLFVNHAAARMLDAAQPTREPLAFHKRLPGYAPSKLHDLRDPGAAFGLERLWVKDESSRMGLPAFKILGASWAVFRAVSQAYESRTGQPLPKWASIEELAALASVLQPMTLACATDGNHGRAVARMAKWLGFSARIFVPHDMAQARIEAIAGEGAEVIVHDGGYDDAVARSAHEGSDTCLVISDTAWPGYQDVPRWVIEGYSTMLWEVDDELARLGERGPDIVAVQIGVGALAGAVVAHYRRPGLAEPPFLLGVEPSRAACAMASMEAGELVGIPGPHDSIMSGLNCGIPSPVAWPLVSGGIDAFVTIDDERTREAMRMLARAGVVAGECGGAGPAGLAALREMRGGTLPGLRALVISTEGATDPVAYRAIVAD